MPRKNPATTQEVEPKRKAALTNAAAEVLPGNRHGGDPPQERLDGTTVDMAWEEYKELAGDYAKKAQAWADAQELRDVRLDDLVKVHAHRPFDEDAAGKVARETAKAVQHCRDALEAKQAAKKALDAAWATVRNFEGENTVRPLIPDDE